MRKENSNASHCGLLFNQKRGHCKTGLGFLMQTQNQHALRVLLVPTDQINYTAPATPPLPYMHHLTTSAKTEQDEALQTRCAA